MNEDQKQPPPNYEITERHGCWSYDPNPMGIAEDEIINIDMWTGQSMRKFLTKEECLEKAWENYRIMQEAKNV